MQQAVATTDPVRRITLISAFVMTWFTSVELGFNKPFNPLLGETYELQTPNFNFMSEQVSHHPPITAWFLESTTQNKYKIWSNFQTTTWLTTKGVVINQLHPTFLEIGDEVYKIIPPTLSVHNLIMGAPYVDVGGTATVTKLVKGKRDLKFEIEFFNRGWWDKSYD